jgi:hypothetical protein
MTSTFSSVHEWAAPRPFRGGGEQILSGRQVWKYLAVFGHERQHSELQAVDACSRRSVETAF